MTTLASFATFSTPLNGKVLKPTSVYVLADSKMSWKNGNVITNAQQNVKKVFFVKKIPALFSYCGDGNAGFKILSTCTSLLESNAAVRNPISLLNLIDSIKSCFDNYMVKMVSIERVDTIRIHCICVFKGSFYHFLLVSNKNETSFSLVMNEEINEKEVFYDGSGNVQFMSILDENKKLYNGVNESAIFFHSFIEFLKRSSDPFSSLPAQAIVMGIDGKIKPVFIRHNDKFYLFGNEQNEVANYKFEFDFRDEEFEFLHSSGKIKGGTKKYNFKEFAKKKQIDK